MESREQFESVLNKVVSLPQEVKDELWTSAKVHYLKKGDYSLEQGKTERYVCFMTKGSLRAFRQDGEREITIEFLSCGEFVTAYSSFISQVASPFSLQMMEDGTIIKFPKSIIDKLYNDSHEFERLGRLLAEVAYLKRTQHETEILMCTAEERYWLMMERSGEFVQKIPVKYVASYLGIQPQSLSRIRAKK
jgi:signal-transduction protein with cAMP-binding, CBS, and nucleotidyltransferase domain